ncbi:MAG: beta/alpha barrel domain-containing protein, partial [Thermoplasmata archaeon]
MERWRRLCGGRGSTGAGPDPPPRETTVSEAAGRLTHRKAEHVRVVLGQPVEGRYRYWDDIQLVHRALPEIDFEEIDTRVELLGRRLAAPIVITGMTGGYPDAVAINSRLAEAAADVGIALGVGSERAAVLNGQFPESYSCIARYKVPLKFANLGAPQIIPQRPGSAVVGAAEA